MCWTTDGSMGVYGSILHEDLFDGTTLIRDNFGNERKFKNEQVQVVGNNPLERIKELETALRKITNGMRASIMIADGVAKN